jgi:PAS domain S-box-containing protein
MSTIEIPFATEPPAAGWLPTEFEAGNGMSEMLRALFEGNPDMVFVANAKGQIIGANPSAVAGFGYTREQLEGQSPSMLLPAAVRERHEGHMQGFQTHRSIRSMGSGMDLKARNSQGEEFPVDVMLYPFSAGDAHYTMAVCRRLDAALARSQMQIHALVESVRDYAINLLDPQGRILTWNEGSKRIHGMTASVALGQNYSILFTPEEVAQGEPKRWLEQAVQSGYFHISGWRVGRPGAPIWAEIEFSAIRDGSGKLTGFTRVLHDMTEHKVLEESLEGLKADLEIRVEERTRQLETTLVELRHKNEEVEAFVYIVSHDMRAPLVNLMGFARELSESCVRLKSLIEACDLPESQSAAIVEVLDADLPSAVHFISQSSLKFERLIDALLDLSRYGRQIYRIVESNAGELVASAVANFQKAITEAGATVEVGPLPPVRADMTALGQVFENLIGNSLKYRSPERPLKVEVGGAIEDGAVTYWVRDNGLGIPEAGKSRLFQVFQRFHPQQAQGEGMGLAITHRIVERHGGRIWADSQQGEGTTFHFSIPNNVESSILSSTPDANQRGV